jgi:hypothetical protein
MLALAAEGAIQNFFARRAFFVGHEKVLPVGESTVSIIEQKKTGPCGEERPRWLH